MDWGEVFAKALCLYFRVEVKGLENIPREGPALIVANHSGYAGADAIVLSHLIHARVGRVPRILAHPFFFRARFLRVFSFTRGLREASYRAGLRSLRNGNVVLIFPEGERGNFKSSLKRYRLQPFHAGFLRMAMATHTKVIPCLVTGAEEAHLNLGSLGFGKLAPRLRIPFPLNVFPLPAKWRIRFLPARGFRLHSRAKGARRQKIRRTNRKFQAEMQHELSDLVRARRRVFLTM